MYIKYPGWKKIGEYLLYVCEGRWLVTGNTFFKKRDIHKYTWLSGYGEHKALMYYVLTDMWNKDMLIYVNVLRGAARELSDHHLVIPI